MRRMTIPAIALAITLAPAAVAGQTPDATRTPRASLRGPGVERIIEHRETLGLTVQQVAELRRIQTELREKNEPLLEQLRAARQELTPEQRQEMRERRSAAMDSMRERMRSLTPEQREQMRERMRSATPEQREQMRQRMHRMRPGGRAGVRGSVPPELQPVLEQIRENTRAAATQIHATLTPEQRQKLVELRPARRGPRHR